LVEPDGVIPTSRRLGTLSLVTSSRLALISLVAVNLVPLVGVVALGWSLFDVMILYWLENGIIGVYTLLKVLTSRQEGGGLVGQASKLFVIPFFTVHYGLFWVVHGLFIFSLFHEGGGSIVGSGASFGLGSDFTPFSMPRVAVRLATTESAFGIAALSMIVSHGVSFVTNFLGRGEFRRLGPQALMFQPYGRVIVLHMAVLSGGFAVMLLGQPLLALLLLIAPKIGIDIRAHLGEHRPGSAGAR
jgi:hypothetical protein